MNRDRAYAYVGHYNKVSTKINVKFLIMTFILSTIPMYNTKRTLYMII